MDPRDEDDIIYSDTAKVFCDGGKGALGHPGVYLNLSDGDVVTCPYCSKRFALVEGSAAGAGH